MFNLLNFNVMKTTKIYNASDCFDFYYALRQAVQKLQNEIEEWEKFDEEFKCKSVINGLKEQKQRLQELKEIFINDKVKIVGE